MKISELRLKWNRVLEECPVDRINSVKLDQWYKPLSPTGIDENKQKIYFVSSETNPMMKNMVKANYNVIASSIINVFGKAYSIELVDETPHIVDSPESIGSEIWNHYTFDSFVSGPNNRLALAASLAIAESFTPEYNPLFIYGGSGLGKTHLLTAIAHYVQDNYPEKKVLYVSTEAFTNELVKAIREESTGAFHDKYRQLDILLLDDVQFLTGKDQTQEEIFNTFNALHSANKQVVFSSDKPPKELKGLPDRLIGRFSQGMIADIQPPDYETRVAILQQKVEERNLSIDSDMNEVIDIIAQNITDNIRELEGALTRVIAIASFEGKKITKDLTKRVLTEIFNVKEKDITPENIKKTVSEFFGVKVSEIEGPKRSRNFVYPRQIAIYLIKKHTNMSFPSIAREFGGRDHTTIMHSCEKIEQELETNSKLRENIERIEAQFK